MPELPEVETTRKGIISKTLNQTIQGIDIRHTQLRWPVDKNQALKLPGLVVLAVKRRGKYLLLETKEGHIIIHLGMSGSLQILPHNSAIKKHDHIDLRFNNGYLLRYHDPRRFGTWLWFEGDISKHPLLSKLGPEPLEKSFSGSYLFEKTRRRKVAIKNLIMNSHIVVGAGNIYASESLFMSGIHPEKPALLITLPEAEILVTQIKLVLEKSIKQGGTTLKDFLSPDGQPGYFVQELNVYGRENQPCFKCQHPIEKVVINQRASFFCPQCQPKE